MNNVSGLVSFAPVGGGARWTICSTKILSNGTIEKFHVIQYFSEMQQCLTWKDKPEFDDLMASAFEEEKQCMTQENGEFLNSLSKISAMSLSAFLA